MRVLVGCESSGTVREAFRAAGHEAWSCDLLPADDGSPYHIQGDVLEAISKGGWNIGIFHPPCTDMAVSGAAHFAAKIADGRQARALEFVRVLMEAPIHRVAIENPVSVISSAIRKPDQTIQPYQYGHDASKRTCLWLRNLPALRPTGYVPPRMVCGCGEIFGEELGKYGCPNCNGDDGPARPRWANQTDSGQNRLTPSPDRWKLRSKTYQGIAEAMANQWGCLPAR